MGSKIETENKGIEIVEEKVTLWQFIKNNKKAFIGTMLFTIFLIGILLLAFCRQIFGDAAGDAILGPGVNNGFVLVGNFFFNKRKEFILTLVAVFVALVIYFIFSIIIKLVLKEKNNPRTKTITALIKSCFKFALFVVTFIIILVNWGVAVEGVAIGCGCTGVIVGLACKSIINDMVAGFIIILTDKYFEVGDIIEVDGFQGEVVDVGLRSTRIKCIYKTKIIANSQIDSIIYYSKGTIMCSVYFVLAPFEDIRHVEAIIARELPKLIPQFPQLKSQLNYKGVDGVTDLGISIGFGAVINFNDQFFTKRGLTRAIYLMLTDNNIHLAFSRHIILDDKINGVKSTESEKMESDRFMAYKKSNKNKTIKKTTIVLKK